ncbi:hypothetical protein ACQ5SO_10615 [Rhodovulum sp. DZ06]|uniref:hypothetical protein n=1 Tax=Rhodovulum sp. DZ06 TaxID=3425126 RepID=UPI003D34FF04
MRIGRKARAVGRDPAKYLTPVLMIGVQERASQRLKKIHPLPFYGMLMHHRALAVAAMSALTLDMLYHVPMSADAAASRDPWLHLQVAAALCFAAAVLWTAHSAPLRMHGLAGLLQGATWIARTRRPNRILRRLKALAIHYGFLLTLGQYALGFATTLAAARLLDVTVNWWSAAGLFGVFIAFLALPPTLIFNSTRLSVQHAKQLMAQADEARADPVRSQAQLEDIAPVLHAMVHGSLRRFFHILGHVTAPFKPVDATLAQRPASDPMQTAMAKVFLVRRMTDKPYRKILLASFPLVGAWGFLLVAAVSRHMLPTSLVVAGILLSGLCFLYLTRMSEELDDLLKPSEEELAALPSWVLPSSANAARANAGYVDRKLRPQLRNAIGGVFGGLLAAFLGALTAGGHLNPNGVQSLRSDPTCAFSPYAVFGLDPDDAVGDEREWRRARCELDLAALVPAPGTATATPTARTIGKSDAKTDPETDA